MITLILAILIGLGLGYIFERGDFCFHSTWRGVVRQPRELDLLRAYLLTLVVAIPLVQGMIALGWIDPWIPPLVPGANILGGLIFGVGMVVAATCSTGIFYKLGHGMLGISVALIFWAAGDLLVYAGPLRSLRDALIANPIMPSGENPTLVSLLGPAGWLLAAALIMLAAFYLVRSPIKARGKLWNWLTLGAATGVFTAAVWLIAQPLGINYTFGTSGVPTQVFTSFGEGSAERWWIPLALISLTPGSIIAARRAGTMWVRGETTRRYIELGAGGLLMGIGAAIAGGCNLGHSLIGVPLLSLGSIVSTLAMAAGVFLAHGAVKLVVSRVSPAPTAV